LLHEACNICDFITHETLNATTCARVTLGSECIIYVNIYTRIISTRWPSSAQYYAVRTCVIIIFTMQCRRLTDLVVDLRYCRYLKIELQTRDKVQLLHRMLARRVLRGRALTRAQSRLMILITRRRKCKRPVRCMCRARSLPRTQPRIPCVRSGRSRIGTGKCAAPRIHLSRIRQDRWACSGGRPRRSPICTRRPPVRSNRRFRGTDACTRACKRRPRSAILMHKCRCSVLCSDRRNNRVRSAARTGRSSRCACSCRNSPRW